MNITQIENNITSMLNKFNEENFIYDFLLAYGIPKNTITLLKSGKRNLSHRHNQILLKKKIFFQLVQGVDVHSVIDELSSDQYTYRHEPRFIIVTDLQEILAIDTKTKETLDSSINDLYKNFVFFLPLAGMEKTKIKNESPVADVNAAERMAKIYDEILKDNKFETREDLHNLNIFLSRLLYCFFAEDTGIFKKAIFTNAISYTQSDGSDLDLFFNNLFHLLDDKNKDKLNYPPYINDFPYVNGGLFFKEHTKLKFSTRSRKMMIESGTLDWSEINPDIFGSMIQAVVHPDQRSGLGMHYTSVPNIQKVIEPLFLNDLKENFNKNMNDEKKLQILLIRLANIQVFDPACGSGNFLIISYKEIRLLEIDIFKRLQEISPQKYSPLSMISLSQFYGIERDDFAREIAILSLWLAEHQMNLLFKDTCGDSPPSIPLKDGGNIVCGNAARLEWEKVCPKNKNSEIYVLGNPPYLGARVQDNEHKVDLKLAFSDSQNYKNLDYISAWFYKGAKFIKDSNAKLAFVSTNSICQGEQVELLWPKIFDLNIDIFFAHTSFKWTNNAKKNAGVTCVIIGLQSANSNIKKKIFSNEHFITVSNINAYLAPSRNIIISRLNNPISNVLPRMNFGNMPNDGGNLLLNNTEKDAIVSKYPDAKSMIRKLVGSIEFIRGTTRWCLWISDEQRELALKIPPIGERILLTQKHRELSKDSGTNRLALRSHQFRDTNEAKKVQIIVPSVSSEKREYLPIGFLSSDNIILNSAQAIYDPAPFVFGLVASKLHMVWVRAVGGSLESRLRYSATICYNNFPVPELTDRQKDSINFHVYNLIDERGKHPEKTIAELYDPNKMPSGLREAHFNLDRVVEQCYRSSPFNNDDERLEYLFNLYEQIISNNSWEANE